MEHSGHIDRFRIRSILSQRVARLSWSREEIFSKLQKPFRILILGTAALCFGIAAHRLDRKEAKQEFEKAHPPTTLAWTHSLGSRGYYRIQKAEMLDHALRFSPMRSETESGAWMTPDGRWILATLDRAQFNPLFFARGPEKGLPSSPPKNWSWMGEGWDGFEVTLQRIDELPRPIAPKKPPVAAPLNRVDPREIRF